MPIEVSTAENVSNLAWLIFASISLVLWHYRVLPHLGGRPRRSLCALLGVLLLMFPIISISDDLHPDLVAAVEGESKSRLLKPAEAPHPMPFSNWHSMLWAMTLAGAAGWPVLFTLERMVPAVLLTTLRLEASSFRFRAPPLLHLSLGY
jgi:hypothetical protein